MKQLSIIVSLIITLIACNFLKLPEAKYGREQNQQRMEVGVPLIEDDWELSKVHSREATWVTLGHEQKYDNNIPVHWSKYLNYRDGSLISETDTYYGENDYYLDWEEVYRREKLTITYAYQKDEYVYKGNLGWNIRLYNQENPTGKEISLQDAEQILTDWGIERLSYEFSP